MTGALVIMVYAISQAPTAGWTATRTLALLASSAALLAAFVVIEARAQAPLLPLRLFRLKTLAGSNAVGFLLGASFYGYIFIGTLYMQQVLEYSAMKTGLAWLTVGLTGVVLAGPAQMLVTRASTKLVMAVGMTLTGAGILWATQVPAHGSFWANLAGPFFLTGTVTWVFIPVSIGALVGVTERDARVASGLIDSSQQLGGAIEIAVASAVAAARSRVLLGQGHAIADAAHRRIPRGILGLRARRPDRRPRRVPPHPAHRNRPGRRGRHAAEGPGPRSRRLIAAGEAAAAWICRAST